jgi:hypothetical protein
MEVSSDEQYHLLGNRCPVMCARLLLNRVYFSCRMKFVVDCSEFA